MAYPGAVRSPPAVDRRAGAVVVAWQGASPIVRVLDLETGRERWAAPVAPVAAAPLVHAGRVVVADGDGERRAQVVARDLRTGEVVWGTSVPASFESGIEPGAEGDDVVVVDHFGTVTALDATDGRLRWQRPLDEPVLRTRLLLTAEVVALTTYAGELVVLNRETGRVRDRWWLEGFPVSVVVGGHAPGEEAADVLVALRLADPGRVESVRLH
jgi:outer membrane protein assembly factor BamB